MSEPWWLHPRRPRQQWLRADALGLRPILIDQDARALADATLARRAGFTPEWSPVDGIDAGAALVAVFGEQAALIAQRINRLPEKGLIELFQTAGATARGPRPAEAIVQFTVAPAAPSSVLVPAEFQISANAADGTPGQVIFETLDQVHVTSAKLTALQGQVGASLLNMPLPAGGSAILPFGPQADVGNALLIGLKGDAAPTTGLSLAFQLAPSNDMPAPASAGGIALPPLPASPLLQWEILSDNGAEVAEIVKDETRGFRVGGIVELKLPGRWEPLTIDKLRWLRVRLLQGRYAAAPRLTSLFINAVRVRATRTVRSEALQPIALSDPPRFALAQKPVWPGSLVLEIDEGVGGITRWQEVIDLADYGPDERVFELNAEQGEVTFGTGLHGRAAPAGFRNVTAVKYQVSSGKAGRVAANAIRTLVQSAPFVTGVANPFAATGGADADDLATVVRLAPRQLVSRGRAVAAGDYSVQALGAAGADVRRAHAVAGRHPNFPGRFQPGVVGLTIVPAPTGSGPPLATEAELAAVARHLAEHVAVAGVEVVVGAPRFRRLQAEVAFLADPAFSVTELIRQIDAAINGYIDPLTGGDGGGWPFEQPLGFHALQRRLLSTIAGLLAIPKLRLTLDGAEQSACADIPLGPDELFWPGQHNIYPHPPEDAP